MDLFKVTLFFIGHYSLSPSEQHFSESHLSHTLKDVSKIVEHLEIRCPFVNTFQIV